MRRTRKHLEPMCDVQEMSNNTELTTKTATLRACSRVHVVLRVGSLDLGFHVTNSVGRLNVQHTTKCKVLFLWML